MKNTFISLLQKVLGLENYLFVFSIFVYRTLKWDKNEKDFLKLFDLIEEDGIVLDIGSNIGVMTTHFSKRLKSSEVFSFEPIPYNIKTLKRIINFFRLRNVIVFECALSDHEGEIEMIVPEINSAKKHGLSHVINGDETEGGEVFKVLSKKLDNIDKLTKTKKRITAIKIDVEGHELNVLRGATELIKKNSPIIYCELWPNGQREEVIRFMRSLNYAPNVVENDKFRNFDKQNTQNFFFIPETA